jgi:hypothetical protein
MTLLVHPLALLATKHLGEDTSVSLHITYNDVQKQHGRIRVTSQTRATCFLGPLAAPT